MVVGVTGSFGSGKTTVAKMFAELGAYVIDADTIAHSLMMPGKEVYKEIVRHFGNRILRRNRKIDREKLAEFVFKEKPKLRLLNRLVHPGVIKRINEIIMVNGKKRIVVIDAALLVETGFYKKIDRLIVVRCNRNKQVERVFSAKGKTKKDIQQRIKMQAPLKKKLVRADFIIDNSASITKTRVQVERIWKQLRGVV
ncbi:MAG: dephospho-CoA kinase [Candidatus Omnitrophica bacterium]|nr:dephospho-CoA kinase [Candidatus Omnitrophota bacterium]